MNKKYYVLNVNFPNFNKEKYFLNVCFLNTLGQMCYDGVIFLNCELCQNPFFLSMVIIKWLNLVKTHPFIFPN